MVEPTPREFDCLRCIYLYRKRCGFSPTIRDICILMHISSTNAARCFINNLEKKGKIIVKRGIARGILIEAETEKQLMESFGRTEIERPINTETTERRSGNS